MFSKTIIYIIEAIVAIVLVAWFVMADPFHIFPEKGPKLNNTTINVTDIRSIGQFITAEYYGEALSSYQEAVFDTTNDAERRIYEAASVYNSFIYALGKTDTLVKDMNKRFVLFPFRLFYKTYKDNFENITSNQYYGPMIIYVCKKLKISGLKFDKSEYDDIDDFEEKLVKHIYKTRNDDELDMKFDKDFLAINNDYIKANQSGTEKKKEALMLGRGWVKAGVNFGKITSSNFKYAKDRKTIYFFRMKPEILSYDINPWAVVGKVYGFEFVKVSGKITNPEDIKNIKRLCLEKLRRQAIESHILEQAQANAEKNLKAFFSLITNDDIKQVKFVNSKYDFYADLFNVDTLSTTNLLLFDSLWRKDNAELDTFWFKTMSQQRESLKCLVDSVKKHKAYVAKGLVLPVSQYTATIVKAFSGTKIDSVTINELKQLKSVTALRNFTDSLWFKHPAEIYQQTQAIMLQASTYARNTNNKDAITVINVIGNK